MTKEKNNIYPVFTGSIFYIHFEGASPSKTKESFIFCQIFRWSVVFITVSNENVLHLMKSCKFIGKLSLVTCFFGIEPQIRRKNLSLFSDITHLNIDRPNLRKITSTRLTSEFSVVPDRRTKPTSVLPQYHQ